MTVRGSEVKRAVPPVPQASDPASQPIRLEKVWFQGISVIKLGLSIVALMPIIFIISILASQGLSGEEMAVVLLAFSPFLVPLVLYIIVLVLRTRPAALEMGPTGVRLFRGPRVVKEIRFGPDVRVGVVFVGYWDDLSPGLFRAVGVDENEMSMFDRRGFGPLFGYRFRGGGQRIVVTKRHGWDIRGIQWMWAPLMSHVGRHRMRMDRSMERYLRKRREMGLPVP